MFQAQGKNNFSDIQKLVEERGWNLYRVQNNSRKFIVRNDQETRVFNWVNPIQSLYDIISQKSFDEFLKTHTVVMTGNGEVQVMEKKEKKTKISGHGKLANELNEKLTAVTVKIMSMKIKRGSEEHLELRKQLYEIRAQMKELGIVRQWGTGEMTADELREARKYGEAKKRERREKRLAGEKTRKPRIKSSEE